jgi:hypothetical protein
MERYREGYIIVLDEAEMRTHVPICGTGSTTSAYRPWSDEGNVDEQWDMRGEPMSVYIFKNK